MFSLTNVATQLHFLLAYRVGPFGQVLNLIFSLATACVESFLPGRLLG
jgi:hypothetical protein